MLTVVTPAPDHRLVAAADLQAVVAGLSVGAANALIDQASAAIGSYCGRVFRLETVEETIRFVEPVGVLVLARAPVAAIVSITVDGLALGTGEHELDREAGLLTRLVDDRRAAWRAGKTVVRYAAGYEPADVPHDVRRACLTLCVALHGATGRDPTIRSESIPDVRQVSYLDPGAGGGAMPATVTDLLDPYRRPSL